jgi:hypothetical protein
MVRRRCFFFVRTSRNQLRDLVKYLETALSAAVSLALSLSGATLSKAPVSYPVIICGW